MNGKNTLKTITDFALKEGDFGTFQVQLLQNGEPFIVDDSMTVKVVMASKVSLLRDEIATVFDAENGIVGFTIQEYLPTGNYDCEFVVTAPNFHQTFPENGFQSILITPSLQSRATSLASVTPDQYQVLNAQLTSMQNTIAELNARIEELEKE